MYLAPRSLCSYDYFHLSVPITPYSYSYKYIDDWTDTLHSVTLTLLSYSLLTLCPSVLLSFGPSVLMTGLSLTVPPSFGSIVPQSLAPLSLCPSGPLSLVLLFPINPSLCHTWHYLSIPLDLSILFTPLLLVYCYSRIVSILFLSSLRLFILFHYPSFPLILLNSVYGVILKDIAQSKVKPITQLKNCNNHISRCWIGV